MEEKKVIAMQKRFPLFLTNTLDFLGLYTSG